MLESKPHSLFNTAIIVAALGYFVDIYDLLLFTIVKKESVLAIGSTNLLIDSTKIINYQMVGLLVGGIVWGVLADKKGGLVFLFVLLFYIPLQIFLQGL